MPDQVTLSPRYAWTVHFDNGTDSGLTVDLGRESDGSTVPTRVLRMIDVWPTLVSRWPKPTLIDLRYPNGFALRAEGLRLAEDRPAARPPVVAKKPRRTARHRSSSTHRPREARDASPPPRNVRDQRRRRT